jgi:excisionase family DNA binding protein
VERERTFLTTCDLAQLLGISTRTVCLWAELGEIPAFRAGRQWRFRRPEIDSWLGNARNDFVVPQPPRGVSGNRVIK